MAKTALARSVDLEPIDRLEEKVKLLVAMVTRLRAEHAKALDDNLRLTQDMEALRARLADADDMNGELSTLRDERELIRSRVSEMLQQLEGL
jgi:hypothetical protein